MTEKFTEEEYQKIVEFADKYFDEHKELAIPVNLESIYKDIFYSGIVEREKFRKLTQKFVLIALPESREWAHDQFVEKGAKFYWRSKVKNCYGDDIYLEMYEGLITRCAQEDEAVRFDDKFTEEEVIEAGYNPAMYERVYQI